MSSADTEVSIRKGIRDNVLAEVARAGYDRSDLAAEVFDGARMNVWRRTRGDVPFSGVELVRIAGWLGVPITTLITDELVGLSRQPQEVAAA